MRVGFGGVYCFTGNLGCCFFSKPLSEAVNIN
jgi:hypothetical protein